MVDLPKRKVGLIACSGEELACGTLSRIAVRQVLESLRPDDTVTLCLPLFLAGSEQERGFARLYPTVAVDGCDKQCAKRATEKYSARVAGEVVVDRLLAEQGVAVDPAWRRTPGPEGMRAAHGIAEAISKVVDSVLGKTGMRRLTVSPPPPAQATCSCGGGLAVSEIEIAGATVALVALELVLDLVHGQSPVGDSALGFRLLAALRIYNVVPAEVERDYEQALLREYHKRFGAERA